MDSDEEVTWVVTENTVKDRMIDSSLIHRFSDSKKFQRTTQLVNKLIEKYRSLNRYKDYVKMKKLINQKVRFDREIEDEDSFGEDYYNISHKIDLSSINNSIYSNENIDISTKSTCKNNIKKFKNAIPNKKNTSLTTSMPNEMPSTDLNLPKKKRKRLGTLQINDQNEDAVSVKKKRLIDSPKQCLKRVEKTQEVHNKMNSSNSCDTTDINVLFETSINHTKTTLDTKNNNLLMKKKENKQHNDFNNKIEIMENKLNEPDTHMNHLPVPNKYSMDKKLCLDSTSNEKGEVVDDIEVSNVVNDIQEMVSHNVNDIIQNIENSSQSMKENVSIDNQKEVTCNSNVTHDDMNISDIIVEKPKNNICSSNSVVLQLQRSPPKVKSTEIINKRYKIVAREESSDKLLTECYNDIRLLESSTPLKYPKRGNGIELEENEEYEDSISSSMLSAPEKRLRQLKNLNLTLENTSSSSEDEMQQQKDNLNKTTALNNLHSIALKKNTTLIKLKLNKSRDTNHKKDTSCFDTQNMNNNTNKNNNIDQHNKYNKDLTKDKKISSKNIEPKIQTLSERPRNLEDFIKEEKIAQDTTASLFTLQNFSKDEDIFLVDMPVTVQLANLEGQRIMLKKKKLILGKNKYEILYKDIPAQSCVFSTCKDSISYKMVNIKPTGSILVRRKLFSLSGSGYAKPGRKSYYNVHKNK